MGTCAIGDLLNTAMSPGHGAPGCGKRQEPNLDQTNEGQTQRIWACPLGKKITIGVTHRILKALLLLLTSAPSCFPVHGRTWPCLCVISIPACSHPAGLGPRAGSCRVRPRIKLGLNLNPQTRGELEPPGRAPANPLVFSSATGTRKCRRGEPRRASVFSHR